MTDKNPPINLNHSTSKKDGANEQVMDPYFYGPAVPPCENSHIVQN